jgi:ribosomal protein S6E (S10)
MTFGQLCQIRLSSSFPANNHQKLIKEDQEHKLCTIYEKRMATELIADVLAEDWMGCVVQINGGNDKHSFPMSQGVLTHSRVCLLPRRAFLK